MGRIETFAPFASDAVTRVLATFDRDQLAGFIAVAIDLLDLADGDSDAEEDDPSGQCDEDGFNTDLEAVRLETGPGCPLFDPGGAGENDDHGGYYRGRGTVLFER